MSFPAASNVVDRVIEAANFTRSPQTKCYIVVHDVECPPGTGWAEALAGGYFANPETKASTHYIVDGDSVVQMVPEDQWAWGTGSPSSRYGIHIEQAGYASFTEDQWLGRPAAIDTSYERPNGSRSTFTADDAASMRAQFGVLTRLIGDICKRRSWSPVAAVEGDLQREVQGQNLGRHIRHQDATAWVGGTSHHDPGPGYPWLYLLQQAQSVMAGQAPVIPIDPATPPIPVPAPTDVLEDIMASSPAARAEFTADIVDKAASEILKVLAEAGDVDHAIRIVQNRFAHKVHVDGTSMR